MALASAPALVSGRGDVGGQSAGVTVVPIAVVCTVATLVAPPAGLQKTCLPLITAALSPRRTQFAPMLPARELRQAQEARRMRVMTRGGGAPRPQHLRRRHGQPLSQPRYVIPQTYAASRQRQELDCAARRQARLRLPAIAYTVRPSDTTPSPCRGVGRSGRRRQRRVRVSYAYTSLIVPPGCSPPIETIVRPTTVVPVPPRAVGTGGSRVPAARTGLPALEHAQVRVEPGVTSCERVHAAGRRSDREVLARRGAGICRHPPRRRSSASAARARPAGPMPPTT